MTDAGDDMTISTEGIWKTDSYGHQKSDDACSLSSPNLPLGALKSDKDQRPKVLMAIVGIAAQSGALALEVMTDSSPIPVSIAVGRVNLDVWGQVSCGSRVRQLVL